MSNKQRVQAGAIENGCLNLFCQLDLETARRLLFRYNTDTYLDEANKFTRWLCASLGVVEESLRENLPTLEIPVVQFSTWADVEIAEAVIATAVHLGDSNEPEAVREFDEGLCQLMAYELAARHIDKPRLPPYISN